MARITTSWLLRGGMQQLGLSQSEALILLTLLDHLGRDGLTWCPQRKMSQDLHVARSTVQSAEKRLRELGAIIEHVPATGTKATVYRVGDQRSALLARSQGR